MERIEVRSRSGNAHLDMFYSRPKDQALQLINSASAFLFQKEWNKKVMDIC